LRGARIANAAARASDVGRGQLDAGMRGHGAMHRVEQ
jgi:hypothetical protein